MESSFAKYLKGRSLQEFVKVTEGEQQLQFKVEAYYRQVLNDIFDLEQHNQRLYKPKKEEEELNRYCNVLPYSHNRVMLQEEGYVNASHIKLISKGDCAVIASQAPKKPYSTFWKMVLEQNVGLVVMLCAFNDPNRGKQAEKYWPNDKATLEEDGIRVLVDKEPHPSFPEFQERTLTVQQNDTTRNVAHIHVAHSSMQWFGWQDFGVPSKSSYDIVKELCDVMIRTVADGKGIVIHCSAGIGRTGTILAIVDAMRIINAGDFADLSIFKLVYNLRMHRYGSVQTVKQYQFIYAFLREYIKRGINPVKQ